MISVAVAEEVSVCGEEYDRWCEINHPMCDFYRGICAKEKKEIFPKYEEPLYGDKIIKEDEDFTTPSKRQVLLNRLQVIEELIKSQANPQAILSNIKAFQNQTEKYVVNELRKGEILAYSEALAQSIIE